MSEFYLQTSESKQLDTFSGLTKLPERGKSGMDLVEVSNKRQTCVVPSTVESSSFQSSELKWTEKVFKRHLRFLVFGCSHRQSVRDTGDIFEHFPIAGKSNLTVMFCSFQLH